MTKSTSIPYIQKLRRELLDKINSQLQSDKFILKNLYKDISDLKDCNDRIEWLNSFQYKSWIIQKRAKRFDEINNSL